jgi:hypothetical protein
MITPQPQIALYALPGIPNVQAGDDLVQLILDALERVGLTLTDGDVVVVTQKIVSKTEGCAVALADVEPSPEAIALAAATDKDPRLVEVILRGSRGVVRQREGTLIMETQHGWICANAGVDRSNVSGPEGEIALTLPVDPDASAQRIREGLMSATGADVAVIITDTHGRPSPTCAGSRIWSATRCASPPSPAPTSWQRRRVSSPGRRRRDCPPSSSVAQTTRAATVMLRICSDLSRKTYSGKNNVQTF